MKNLIIGVIVGMLVGTCFAWATLPLDLPSRIFNSFVETSSGNVAQRIVLVQ